MRNNEQFYTSWCGIMIDGDVEVRLHHRNDYNDLRDPDRSEYGPAEVHYKTGDEFNSIGRVTVCGRVGSKLGWASRIDDGKPGDGITDDALRRTPLPKNTASD